MSRKIGKYLHAAMVSSSLLFAALLLSTGAAIAKDLVPVSMIYFTGSSEALEIGIMQEEGIFAKNGLKPEFVNATSGPAITAAMASGTIQFGPGYPALYLPALKQERALQVAAPFAQAGFYNIIAQPDLDLNDPGVGLNKNSEENIRRMRGRKVGVTALGAQTQIFVQLIAQQSGIDYHDILFVSTGAPATALAAFKNKQIDFLVTFFPEDGLIQQLGIEHKLAINANSGPDNSYGLINGLWLVNADFARENPKVALAFCRAAIEGRQFIQDPKNKDRVLNVMQKYLGLNKAGAELVYDRWRYVFEPIGLNYISEDLWSKQSAYLLGTSIAGYVPSHVKYMNEDCMQLGREALKK